jgi:hypothetical protein
LLNLDREPTVFLRKTEDKQATGVTRNDELDARIREANSKDVELFDAFMQKLRLIDGLRDEKATEEGRAPPKGMSAWRDIG